MSASARARKVGQASSLSSRQAGSLSHPLRNAERPVNGNGTASLAPRVGSITSQVARLNKWRDQYNPLRGITIARAIQLLETYRRGEFADLQWSYSFAEEVDEDLFALVERRTSAIVEMDWSIKITPENKRRDNFDEALADDQAAALREAYDRIDNLYDGIEHLAMATFRGFAHMEKQSLKGNGVDHLEVVDQWNMVRDGYRGPWKYNPDARQTTYNGLAGEALPLDRFVWRQVSRHVNRIGLVKLLRSGLGVKDWVAFIEIYGIPSGIVIMPANTPAGKEDEYKESATRISEGGNGALPNGSDYKPNDAPRGVNPFSTYLEYLTQKLVLVGTGGLLTMLTQSGSGTLAGSAHTDTFKTIARGEARKISQSFCRDFDAEVLEANFAGKPRLAYFELSATEETDTSSIVEEVLKLSQAGYQADPAEVSEKTGYTLTLKPQSAAGILPAESLRNRAGNSLAAKNAARLSSPKSKNTKETLAKILRARATVLQPLLNRIAALEKAANPAALAAAVADLRRALPDLADQLHDQPELAQAIFDALSETMAEAAVDELRQKGTLL